MKLKLKKVELGKDLNNLFEDNEAGIELPEDPDDYPKK